METLVKLQNITKYYGPRLAVDNVSFEVKRGQVVGFLGPNGAGKTTTMRIITGYLPPTSGYVEVCGFDVLENPTEAKKRIGYLPEMPPLYPEMKVVDYLKFVGKIKGLSKSKLKQRLEYVLAKCGLEDVKNRVVGNLSRGYKQRVGIAQALIHDPDVIIFDEPTVGLDPQQVVEVRALIKEIAQDHTVILSTHILSEVEKICTDVIMINQGRIVFRGKIGEVAGEGEKKIAVKLKNEDMQKALGILNRIAESVETSDGRIILKSSRDIRQEVLKALAENGIFPLELFEIKPSLEEIYLRVISRAEAE